MESQGTFQIHWWKPNTDGQSKVVKTAVGDPLSPTLDGNLVFMNTSQKVLFLSHRLHISERGEQEGDI